MSWDFTIANDFPETAEWFEFLYADNLDDLEPEPAGAIEFRFRMSRKSDGRQEPIPGLKLTKTKEYKIECKPGLNIKPEDIIRFNNDPRSTFRVQEVDYIVDSRNENEYQNTMSSWPGLAQDNKIMLITIK